MTASIRVPSDSNAHDRSRRVAVEQGFFAAEGLDVEYTEDNPRGGGGAVHEIKLAHTNDRLQALLSGDFEAAGLMEPLASRAAEAGARNAADLAWRGGIVASDDVGPETGPKLVRALNRAVEWLRVAEARQRSELLRDLKPELQEGGLLPELIGAETYSPDRFEQTARWMTERGFLPQGVKYEDVVRSKK